MKAFGFCGALFGDSGAPRGGTPFRTLFGLFWGSGPEGRGRPLCLAGAFFCGLRVKIRVLTPERLGGRKTAQEKKTNSWKRRFPGTFRTNVPLILPIFSVFSVGGGPKVPRNFVPGNFFFLF